MSIDAIGSAIRFSKTYRGMTEEEGLRTKEVGLKPRNAIASNKSNLKAFYIWYKSDLKDI